MNKMRLTSRQYAEIALLVLMTLVLSYVELPIPYSTWLKWDPSGSVAVLAMLLYGPIIACFVAIIAWVPHIIADPVGASLNICATLTLMLIIYALYQKYSSRRGMIVSIAIAVIVTTVFLLLLNFAITPLVLGVPYEVLLSMVPTLAIFNALKALVNTLLAFICYRRLAVDEQGAIRGFIVRGNEEKKRSS